MNADEFAEWVASLPHPDELHLAVESMSKKDPDSYSHTLDADAGITVSTRDNGDGNGFDLVTKDGKGSLLIVLDHESWYSTDAQRELFREVPKETRKLLQYAQFALLDEDEVFASIVLFHDGSANSEWEVSYGHDKEDEDAGQWLLEEVL